MGCRTESWRCGYLGDCRLELFGRNGKAYHSECRCQTKSMDIQQEYSATVPEQTSDLLCRSKILVLEYIFGMVDKKDRSKTP